MTTDHKRHIISLKRKIGQKELIIMLAGLMACNALAIDIMLPAFPQLIEHFAIANPNHIQYTISFYLLGFAIFQLIFGPLSDRYGRRLPLLVGLSIYIFCGILCLITDNYAVLLALRFAQGASASSTRILSQSISRDLYKGRDMARVMSFVLIVFMVVPIIAPSVGQLILLYFHHWEYIFAFVSLFGFTMLMWAYFRLPETLYEKRPLTFSGIKSSFSMVFSNKTAMLYNLSVAFVIAAIYGSLNSVQQIYVDIYHLGVYFPLAFGLVGVMSALFSLVNTRLIKSFTLYQVSHTQLLFFTFASGIWVAANSIFNPIPLPLYLVIYGSTMCLIGALIANFSTIAMINLGNVAGTAASVFGFTQNIIGTTIGIFLGQAFNGTTRPLATGFLTLGLIAVAAIIYAERGKLFINQNEQETAK